MAGTAAFERVAGAGVSGIRSPDLIGRDQELAALTKALAAGPAVVLVEGEAGVGKSRLIQEYLTSPEGQQRRSLTAVCPPFRQPFTLGPVVDALRRATENVAGLRLSPLAGALRPLFPEWADDLPPTPETLDPRTALYRLFRALAELLARLEVAVLVIEDVHWADEASQEFLLFLTSSQPPLASLVATYRPEDVPEGSLVRRLSSRRPAGATRERITLGPLDTAATAGVVASMLPGGHVSAEFADFLYAHTEGLPLAIEESVRLLRERRDLRRRDGEWVRRSLDALIVPPTIRDAVLERAGRLDGEARAVLQGAAVLAIPADGPMLTAVTGLSPGAVRAGLARALGCGLLAADGYGLVSFHHVLAARAVYEAITAPERQEMHLRAGQALNAMSPLPVAQLARHARAAGETAAWCRFAEQAADLALASGDEVTVAAMLHDLIVNADLPVSDLVRLMRKIPLYSLRGHEYIDELATMLRALLSSDRITAADQAEVRYHLGRTLMHTREYGPGTAELERAVPGLAHRPVEAVHAMTMLGNPSQTLQSAEVHRRWLDRAAQIAARGPIPADEYLKFTVFRVGALLELGDEAGWPLATELPEDATAPMFAQHLACGWANVGDAAMQWGRYQEARRWLAGALRLADRYGYPRLRDIALTTEAHLDWFSGAWAGLAERLAALADRDDPMVGLDAMLVAGLLEAAQGSAQTAEKKLRHVLEEERRRGLVTLPLESAAALARLRLAEGRAGEALALTEEPIRVITSKGIWLWATEVAPAHVLALTTLGRRREAADLLAAYSRRLSGRDAAAPLAALLLCRAIMARGHGEHDRAAALFGQAAAAWQALPRPYDALLAREQQGHCLLAAGRDDAGLAMLRDVFSNLSSLGASGDAERVVRQLRSRGVHVPRLWRHGRRGYGRRLSPRELEVVRQVVAGHTTQQIARELCRSPSTVSTQIQSAMRKLSVRSRAALAARAVEIGVLDDDREPVGDGAAS